MRCKAPLALRLSKGLFDIPFDLREAAGRFLGPYGTFRNFFPRISVSAGGVAMDHIRERNLNRTFSVSQIECSQRHLRIA